MATGEAREMVPEEVIKPSVSLLGRWRVMLVAACGILTVLELALESVVTVLAEIERKRAGGDSNATR